MELVDIPLSQGVVSDTRCCLGPQSGESHALFLPFSRILPWVGNRMFQE